jgi:aspartate racemase
MIEGARRLTRGGADILLICSNTMHKLADQVAGAAGIPLLHIADATANAVTSAGIGCVGLLGTRFTMEQDFYRGRLADRHGLEVLIPDEGERQIVHTIIYDELCVGAVLEESRRKVVDIIDGLVGRGAEGVVLGCTELPLLIRPSDVSVRLFDTTAIHVAEAVRWALSTDE